MTRRPELPIFYIDCTRPLAEQLTPGQLAWIEVWAEPTWNPNPRGTPA